VAYLIAGRVSPPKVPFLVSVLGCSLARDQSSLDYGLVGHSIDSFASNLHRLLREQHGLVVNLFARPHDVGIAAEGAVGTKGVYAKGAEVPSPIEYAYRSSKVLYYWEGTKQLRLMVNYAEKTFEAFDLN
jgi:hypothetical protein